MRSVPAILLVLFTLALVTFAGLEWLARIENKHPGEIKFSNSLEDSKKNATYVAGYRPLANNIKLPQVSAVINFNSAYAERGWIMDTSGLYLFAKKLPADVYNFIIDYSETPATGELNFDLVHLSDSIASVGVAHYGNHLLLQRTKQLTDTIWFTLLEKSKDTTQGWVEMEDVVGFVKDR